MEYFWAIGELIDAVLEEQDRINRLPDLRGAGFHEYFQSLNRETNRLLKLRRWCEEYLKERIEE